MSAPVKRGFVDLDTGQLHYRRLVGAGGGAPQLVLLHQASGSSKAMLPFAAALLAAERGRRDIVVPDLPGNGDSDPHPRPEPDMADFAAATAQGLVRLGLTRIDLYGFHAGASVALEIALARPDLVGRLVLDSMGLYTPADGRAMAARYAPELRRDIHGTHLLRAWHYVRDTYLFWPWYAQDAEHARGVGVPDVGFVHDKVVELLKGIDSYHLLYRAAFLHDKQGRLPDLAVRTLVTAGESNSQRDSVAEIATLVPGSETRITPGIYTPEATRETAVQLAAWFA